VVSELPRADARAVEGREPGSAYRPEEPQTATFIPEGAAWVAGLEGWVPEGQLSHADLEGEDP
jgi:hypothetical protein